MQSNIRGSLAQDVQSNNIAGRFIQPPAQCEINHVEERLASRVATCAAIFARPLPRGAWGFDFFRGGLDATCKGHGADKAISAQTTASLDSRLPANEHTRGIHRIIVCH
mmetsp:Transcript_113697/g.178897  ORF Transcript_113697/g.178897 Transcript_113697/m.178897 type:complete len:109 (+) Transcript_113697:90-416(+)